MKRHNKFQALSHAIMIFISICSVLPFWILIMASFSDEAAAAKEGYALWPRKFSLVAYQYLAGKWQLFGQAYGITILTTVIGVVVGVAMMTAFGYMLSKKDLPGRNIITFYLVFTMLFSGGMVASYIMWANTFHIKNTIWALIIPNMLANAFNIILIRNYYGANFPVELEEAARIDGASEFKIFVSVAAPLSKPIIATVGLMSAIMYWNSWTNGMYFLDNQRLYGIQNLLNAINESTRTLLTTGGGSANLPAETTRMAAAVLGMLPILVAYPFFQDYFVKGITVGAVKG